MDIPKRLYKYRSGTAQDLTNLSNAKLWFSHPTQFNDPFDCAYDIVIPKLSREQCVSIFKRLASRPHDANWLSKFSDEDLQCQIPAGLKSAVESGLNAVGGVSCFSAINDNLLMWGHYGRGHRGFCLEFDTSADPAFLKSHKVRYSNAIPQLGVETFLDGDFSQLMGLLLTKAKCWEYEQEWRVLHNQSSLAYGHERECLTGIYFGAKMPNEQKQMIATLLSRTDTRLYEMRVSRDSFTLMVEPQEFTPIDYRKVRSN